eukprot:TRINITY_DN10646_c0_g1_i4.p1 TRINITY_DN10646_c0_g1~~TRINITY_DN10646_c0_g1_i4.p1  ORF type:complete len:674 (-),score=52.78 TRINITY_DN10646_c0_g1_i4:377-2398(-)
MSILSYGSMSFRQGGWHVMNVLELSVPTFLFAFALLTIPACCVVLYVSDHILELVNDGDTFQSNGGENLGIVINHFFWSAETTMRIPDITPFLMNAILREVTYCLVGSVSFCLIAYRGAKREYSLAALIAGSGVSFSFFVVGVGFHVFYLDNVYNVTAIEEPVLRAIVGIFTWLPCMVGMYASLFPREARLRTLLYFVATLVGATVLYYCWRLFCMTYFFVPSRMIRVVIGISAPSLMFTLGIQLFVPIAVSLYEYTNLHAGLLLLLQPLYLGATMCSIIELTSNDLVTGASIEVICLVFGICLKISLLNGYTPIDQIFVVCARALRGLFCISRSTQQKHTPAKMDSVVPAECVAASSAENPSDLRDQVRAFSVSSAESGSDLRDHVRAFSVSSAESGSDLRDHVRAFSIGSAESRSDLRDHVRAFSVGSAESGSDLRDHVRAFSIGSAESRRVRRDHVREFSIGSAESRRDLRDHAFSISEYSVQTYGTESETGGGIGVGTDEAHMDDHKDELALPVSREERRQILLSCAVRYSTLVEVIAHLLSAGFVILVMANPNEVGQPPLPIDRVLVLLFIKLLLELSTDFILACCASACCAPQSRFCSCEDLRTLDARRVHIDICLLAVFFATDAHTLLAQFLCPDSTSADSSVSFLSSLMETRRVGVVGQCPSPLL